MSEMNMYTDPGMERRTVPEFLAEASACDMPLIETAVQPKSLIAVERRADSSAAAIFQRKWEEGEIAGHPVLRKGERICLDFGDHYVGYVTLKLNAVGSPQDAPAFVKLKFAEIPAEILDDSASYNGWISRGWIQEEWLHLDVLPAEVRLPRRYAFRYLEILALDTSNKFSLMVEEVHLTAVSAVSLDTVRPLGDGASRDIPELLRRIDRVALKTLQDCMQHVFEDGPKRDRRLWLGDFRLQAKTNYATFRNDELAKRCLYLFAETTRADGLIAACLFTEPQVVCDDTFLWDFSLFFASALYDYYAETGDKKTLADLWPSAYRQIELARADMEGGILKLKEGLVNVFIDWKEGLERQAAAQGVFIYVLRQALELSEREAVGTEEQTAYLRELLTDALEKAVSVFWDEKRQCFVSGESRQASKISQAWMVLADVLPPEEGAALMLRTMADDTMTGVLTPYAYHCLTEAMVHAGEREKALEMIGTYWGGMVSLGADTFWESYDPADPYASPYDNMQVNSFCHAWSCTPAWLLRELLGRP